jgi:hypothetical protein
MPADESPEERVISMYKIIAFIALQYLAFIAATCPCRPELYRCHITQMYIALAVVIAIIVRFNGARVVNY